VFRGHTLAEWEERLATLEGVWAPLKSPAEVIADEQALANGFVTPVALPGGDSYLTGASPAQFDGRPIGPLRAAPTHGADTDAVLGELGLTTDRIRELRERGIVA